MVSKTAVIHDLIGLHLRPATDFCKKAMEFPCAIKLQVGNKTANGKSVLGVLALGAKNGAEVTITCQGEKEEQAVELLADYMESLQ